MATVTGPTPLRPIPDREFDVRANEAQLRTAEKLTRTMLPFGVGVFFVFGAILSGLGTFRRDWVIVGIGVAMLVAGVYFAFRSSATLRQRTLRLKVSQAGLTFVDQKGIGHLVPWSRPGLKGTLIDGRGQPPGMYTYSNVPCVVYVDDQRSGIPGEAFDAILETVRSLGIPAAPIPKSVPPVTLFGADERIANYRPFT